MAVKKTIRKSRPRLSITPKGVVDAVDEATASEKIRKTPISQVVEVLDEDVQNPAIEPLEEIKEEAKDIVRNADILEKTIIGNDQPEENIQSAQDNLELEEVPAGDEEVKQKEVISDLFVKDEPVGLSEITIHKKRFSRAMFIWLLAVIGLVFLLGTILIKYSGKKLSLPILVKPTPTAAPTSTPTSTPTLTNRADIAIEVINGGGVAGAGSKMKAFLEEKGYTVNKVGNAKEYTYDKTEIVVKASKSNYLTTLEADLKDSYSLGSSSATLADDASTDAQVIVGKE